MAVPDRFGVPARSRRAAAVGLTASLHALALLVFLLPATHAAPAQSRAILTTFDTAGRDAPKPAAPQPPQPRKVPPPPPLAFVAPPPPFALPQVSPVVAAMLRQADAQASAGGCDLTGPIQAALQTSPEVQRVLPAIPEQRRSVANAIALWDRQWVEADPLLDVHSIDTIRTTIVTTIAAASPACRSQPQAGPRLIYIPLAAETTVLALGSGQWTWQQVADSAAEPQAEGVELAMAAAPAAHAGANKIEFTP